MKFRLLFPFILCVSCFFSSCGNHDFFYTNPVDVKTLEQKQGIFYTLGPDKKDTVFFADFPVAYRNFYVPYCATCHSNRWSTADHRQVLNLNTWDDIMEFGPERLFVTAVSGGMPKTPVDSVPAPVLNSTARFLSRKTDVVQENIIGSITGITDPQIEQLIEKYCGACHGHQGSVLSEYNLSTYEQWFNEKLPIKKALETTGEIISMPYKGSRQKIAWDDNPQDKETLLAWIKNGLPN